MDRDELNVNNELNEEKIEEVVIDGIVTDEVIPEPEVIVKESAPIEETSAPQYTNPPLFSEKPKNPALKNKNTFAVIAMVSSIASLIFSCCCFLSIPCGVAALVFGILGLKSERRAMAIAGIVIGVVSIVISLVIFVSVIVALILNNNASLYPSHSSHYLW